MQVITQRPIKFGGQKKQSWGRYSSFDSNNKSDVQAFQRWLNANKSGWLGGINLKETAGAFGTFGPSTTEAYKKYGAEYNKSVSPKAPIGPPTPAPTTTTPPAKDGYKFDRALNRYVKVKESGLLDMFGGLFGKSQEVTPEPTQTTPQVADSAEKPKMSTTKKVLIGVGALVLIGGIIYAVKKANK